MPLILFSVVLCEVSVFSGLFFFTERTESFSLRFTELFFMPLILFSVVLCEVSVFSVLFLSLSAQSYFH